MGFSCCIFSPRPRKIREDKVGHESKHTEEILATLEVQDALSHLSHDCTPKGRLVGVSGSPGHILARPHSPLVLLLPSFPSGDGEVSISQTSLRTSYRSMGVYEASESCGLSPGGGRGFHSHVPKQLVDTFSYQRGRSNHCLGSAEVLGRYGLQCQSREVYLDPHIKASLALSRVGHSQCIPVSRQCLSDSPQHLHGILLLQTVGVTAGGPQLCRPSRTSGTAQAPKIDKGG